MEDKKGRITDKQLSKNVTDAVEELCGAIKVSSRKVFDSMVERSVDVLSEAFDKYKDKIIKKGAEDEKKDNVPE